MNNSLKETAALKPSYAGDLPIHAKRDEIIRLIKEQPVLVIAGETGSGKTTQIPKFLIDAGFGNQGIIGCTQPRRVAALSVAQRIAEELGVHYGNEVGAKIRFTDQTRHDTRIKVMTDGILLNEIQEDPELRSYEAIVVDEAHERSLNIDFILGHLRQLSTRRTDLKIIITSATIDTETFSKAFNNAPIVEVSGRMFPVDTIYRPSEELLESEGDLTMIEAAQAVICEIVDQNDTGDILVFLPSERDIHELRKKLEDLLLRTCEILPLYGRMANADQQRIFHPSGNRRRVILSTNIAETSLTVPGIRYVVDSGLARISYYSASSRTQRLPIQPIAQSSAEQRKGRCGRVSNGVCYRLYSEEDFASRPRYTTPEIHRSNLAAVILRMLAFRLGDVRTFPFIERPTDAAIKGGYRILGELGAVYFSEAADNEDAYELTKLGYRLARFPIDPTVARMLLHAKTENAIEDVLVIASGLSIQDPRERPAELLREADQIQKRFVHKTSDFLTLLNIWNAYHSEMDRLSQSQLRKFCKQHFLSYQRMREWREIHHQLERILKNQKLLDTKTVNTRQLAPETEAGYRAIHRSILSGLLCNVAVKDQEHIYRGARNRKAQLFPGSGLYDHETARKQRKAAYAKTTKPKPAKTTAPDWIVCGEWMETSRLFARTAAKIEAEWIEELAGDLIQLRHSESFWSSKSGAVLCKQRKILFGLEISRSNVSYSRIDPDTATDIFVRNGLVELGIKERPEFISHNETIRLEAESEMARKRLGSEVAVEDALYGFYRSRINAVGSYPELRSFAKAKHRGSLDFLKARLEDLVSISDEDCSEVAFPRSLHIGGSELPLQYKHKPGDSEDGVTLRVPLFQIGAIREGTLDWAVPGHLEEKVESLLRGLPKQIRIQLHPLKDRAQKIARDLKPSEKSLREEIALKLKKDFKIETHKSDWENTQIPEFLKPRIQVETTSSEILASGRELQLIRKTLEEKASVSISKTGLQAIPAWQKAAEKYERSNLLGWTFGDLPSVIDLTGESGLPLKAYPSLVKDKGCLHLRLLTNEEEAHAATSQAWPILCESVLGREIGWMQRELKDLKSIGPNLLALGDLKTVQADAWQHLRRHLFRSETMRPLKKTHFESVINRANHERRGIVGQFIRTLNTLLEARQEIELLLEKKKTKTAITFPGMRAQLSALVPEKLLLQFNYTELPHLTRFLTAMRIRAERAKENLQRDIEKSSRVKPFEVRYAELFEQYGEIRAKPYFILLEEFKVSIYAQELGTAQKVSEKRLFKIAEAIEKAQES